MGVLGVLSGICVREVCHSHCSLTATLDLVPIKVNVCLFTTQGSPTLLHMFLFLVFLVQRKVSAEDACAAVTSFLYLIASSFLAMCDYAHRLNDLPSPTHHSLVLPLGTWLRAD